MEGGVVIWIYRLTTLYLSLWTQGHKKAEDRGATRSTSKLNFTIQVEKCLESFNVIRNHTDTMLHQKRKNKLYFTIYKQTYCRHYEESLQCLHEFLVRQPSEEATTLVQDTLSQPWALKMNQQCDINVKRPTKQTIDGHSEQETKDVQSTHPSLQIQSVHQTDTGPSTVNTLQRHSKQETVQYKPTEATLHLHTQHQVEEKPSSHGHSEPIDSLLVHGKTKSSDKTQKNGKLLFTTKLSKVLRDSISDIHSEIKDKMLSKSLTDTFRNTKVMNMDNSVIKVYEMPTLPVVSYASKKDSDSQVVTDMSISSV